MMGYKQQHVTRYNHSQHIAVISCYSHDVLRKKNATAQPHKSSSLSFAANSLLQTMSRPKLHHCSMRMQVLQHGAIHQQPRKHDVAMPLLGICQPTKHITA
jgi:hypothetical protein